MKMENKTEKIIITEPKIYDAAAVSELRKIGNVEIKKPDEDIGKKIKDATVLLCWVQDKIDKSIIDMAPNLKIIATASAGMDHIDFSHANKKGIKVFSAPGQNARAVAEFTFGLMLSLVRKINVCFDDVRIGKWQPLDYSGYELENKTLGLVGFGKIPRIVSNIAKGFGMKVIAYDAYVGKDEIEKAGARAVTLDYLLKNSDIVSLHVPLSAETKHMINKEEIQQMKDGVFLINTARGDIVDEQAVLEALQNKRIAGYACDVVSESDPNNSMILQSLKNGEAKNLIVTSHIAHATEEAIDRCGLSIVEQIRKSLEAS
jgi:D-3-phosphoglycerate dehydrogenase